MCSGLLGYQVAVDVLSYRYHIPASSHKRHGRQKAQSDVTHEDWFHMVSGNGSELGCDVHAIDYNNTAQELLLKGSTRQKLCELQWQQHYCHSLHRSAAAFTLNFTN